MKCIEDEIPFELPEGWAWCRLNSIVDVRDGTHDTPTYVDKGIPLITSKNLVEGGIDYSNVKYISEKDAISINDRSGVNIGDILFAMIGTIGNPSMVTEDILISIKNVALFKFTFSKNLSNHFVMYFLDYAQEDMKNKPSGGLQPFVSLNFLRTYLVPVPPVEEQQRIVSILADSINKIRNIDVLKNELTASVKKAKSKILDLAIRGKLVPQDPNDEPASVLLERIRVEKEELIKQGKIKRDKKESIIFRGDDNSYYEKIGNDIICIDEELPFDIPHNWSWCRLGNIGDWAAGSTPSRSYPEYYNGTIPWLKTGDLNDGYITNIPESISEEALKNTSVRLNPSGSVLIAMYGATIGKLGILTFPATTNQACCACSPLDGINNHYLFYYLLSQKDNFVYRSVGGAQPNISKEKIVTTLMPVPPYEEQRQILDKIDIFFDLIRDIEKSLN